MQSVILVDNYYSNQVQASHNKKYAEALLNIPGTTLHVDYYEFKYYTKHHYLRGMLERINYIGKIKTESRIYHFLVLDFLYRYPIVFINLKRKGIRIIATLHNAPKASSSKKILKFTSYFIDEIVVHSDYIRDQLIAMGIKNVVSIDYPAFVDKNLQTKSNLLPENKIKIACLGGTRFAKGADIAISAAAKLPLADKEKTVFIIAGKEEDVKYSDICELAKRNDVDIVIDNRVLPEADYWSYINESDAILIPYRKGFTGVSGPMTDGVFFEKTILGPSSGSLGYTIKKYEIGYTFAPEDIDDISNTLQLFLNKKFAYSKKAQEYKKNLSVDIFLEKYERLYENQSSDS